MIDQTKFWLNEIIKIENYFNQEINQRKTCSKKLSKYVAAFDYTDKIWIDLIATVSVVGAPTRVAGASFTLILSLTKVIIKKLLSITRNKEKKHDRILMLAKSKLNSIYTLVI